jgi:rod shape-determining protein MreD
MVVLWGGLIAAGIALAQSTVLEFAEIAGARPDLVLIFLLFVANKNGMMTGQLVAVAVGVVLDVLGAAPLGFHVLVYGIVSALFGVTRGKVFVDPVFIPVLFGGVGVLLKGLIAGFVASLFSLEAVLASLFVSRYWIELAYTSVLTPVLFAVFGILPFLQPDRRRGEVF